MAEFRVDAEYLKKAAQQTAHVKESTYGYLKLESAASVLDVGCGPGVDTIPMAKLATSAKEVVGVDLDEEMVRAADLAAREAGLEERVRHHTASAFSLPFPDGTFDRVRAERLFQVLPAGLSTEESLMKELLRVLAPRGILVLADTDWATVSLNFSDIHLERRLLRFFAESCRPSGFAGRKLFGFLKERDMREVEVTSLPILMYAFREEDPLGSFLIHRALGEEIITEKEAKLWMEELAARSEKGELFGSVNMNIVKGIKA